MNNKTVFKLVTALSISLLLLTGVSASIDILKPTSHTDSEGVTTGPSNAYDASGYDESTASTTAEPRDDSSIAFHTWETSSRTYTELNLTMTVSSTGYTDDTWALYYDATTDTACDSTDSVLKASGSENLGLTNYTVTLNAGQNLADLQVCLSGAKSGGPDKNRQVSIYDIRTSGLYDGTPPEYRNQQQNTSLIGEGENIELSTEISDNQDLSSAILATDESGAWENKTLYGSPQQFSGSTWQWANFTWKNASFSSGTVTWKVWMNDSSGNYNVTETMSFDVDRIKPGVTLHDPKNTTYGTSTIDLKVSADENIQEWRYSLDGSLNTTFTPNITLKVSDGSHTIRAWAQDQAGNWNSSQETFTVDTTPPSISNLKEQPQTPTVYDRSKKYEFNSTVIDPHLDAVRLEFDGKNYTPQNTGDEFYRSLNGLSAGSYSYRWYANDTLGNINATEIRTYDIEKAPVNTTLWLNGTIGDREYTYNASANLSANLNVSSQIEIWDGLSGTMKQRASGESFVQSVLNLDFSLGTYTVKGVFFGNENYTARNQSHSLTIVDNSSPEYVTVFDDNPGRVYQGENVVLKTRWDDNYQLDSSKLAVNSSGQFENVSQDRLSSNGWSNFTYTLPVNSFPGILGWRQWANDTSDNWNLTPVQQKTVWGYSRSNASLSSNSIQLGSAVDVNCLATDANTSAEIQDYTVEVYNGTVKVDEGLTGVSGWYNTTFTPQDTQDNVPVKCAVYEDENLLYTPAENGSKELTVNQGEPPELYNSIYGLNDSTLVVGDSIKVYARWNSSIHTAYVEYDSNSEEYVDEYSTGPFENNYTNFTLDTNTSWYKGGHDVKLYANDSQGNLNNTLARLGFDVRGYADVRFTGPEKEMERGIVPVRAKVTDSNTSEAIEGFNVSYWHNGSRIGYDQTNSTGVAVYDWNTSSLDVGEVSGKVNISDSKYYIAANDTDNGVVNITGMLYPEILAPEGIVHRNTTLDFSSEVYADNGTKVFPSAEWLNSSGGVLATGLDTSWKMPGTQELGNYELELNVSKELYDYNLTSRNLTVYGYSVVERSEFSRDRILEGEKTTYRCRVGADGNSQAIEDYPVEFYNSTHHMGGNLTNATGWASYEFRDDSAGNETIQCRIYDNATLKYNSTSPWIGSDTLETVDTTPPNVELQQPEKGIERIKSEENLFNATYTDNLDLETSRYSFNDSGTFENVTYPVSGTWNSSSHTFTNTSFRGLLGYKIYAGDVYGNFNSTEGTMAIYAGADLHRMDLNTSKLSPGGTVKATCGVQDNVTTEGIENYQVEFYNNSNLLNSKLTGPSGTANFTYTQGTDGSVDLECRIADDTSRYFLADNSQLLKTVKFEYGSSSENYAGVSITHGNLQGRASSIETLDSEFLNWTRLRNTTQQGTNLLEVNATTEIPPETVEEVSFQWDLFRKVDNFATAINDPGGNGIISFSNGDPNSTHFMDSEHLTLTEEQQGSDYELTEKGLDFYLPETESETTLQELEVEARIKSPSDATESVMMSINDFATGGAYGCDQAGGTSYTNASCSVSTNLANYVSTDRVYVYFNDTNRNEGTQTTWYVDRIRVTASYTNPANGNTYEYTSGFRNRSSWNLNKLRSFDPSGVTEYFSTNTTRDIITPTGEMTSYISYFNNNSATAAYREQSIGIDRFQAEVKYQVSQVKDYSLSIKNETGGNLSSVNYTVFRDEEIDSATGSLEDRFASGENYNLRMEMPSQEGYNVTFWNFSVSESVSPDSRFLPYSETSSDLYVENASKVYAIDDSNFDFDNATLAVPKNGTPNAIMHCTDFDFSTSKCNSWDVKPISDYSVTDTGSHLEFNVSGFDAYATSSTTPLPNITKIKIYDVTDAADREQGGTLVAEGLNETFQLEQSEDREYRFEFVIENDGELAWTPENGDELFHRGLNSSWSVGQKWYNLSGQNFGGTFSSGKVSWDTSNGGSLGTEPGNNTMWAKYLVNITENESRTYDEYFEVNDTSENAGSYDYHRLNITKYGFLNVTLLKPADGTAVAQNETFTMNATVECTNGKCGDVNISARYNESAESDTLIPEGSGEPFHLVGTNTNTCGESMTGEDLCYQAWEVNATGALDSFHLIDANASSTIQEVANNDSEDAEITINQAILIDIKWDAVDFGVLDPGAEDKPAPGNDNLKYNITVEDNSLTVDDLWIRGEDMTAPGWLNPVTGLEYTIHTENVSYSDQNDISTEDGMSESYKHLASSLQAGTNFTTFYWLDVPEGIKTAEYTGKVYFKANGTN